MEANAHLALTADIFLLAAAMPTVVAVEEALSVSQDGEAVFRKNPAEAEEAAAKALAKYFGKFLERSSILCKSR